MAKRVNGVMEYTYVAPVLKFDFGGNLVVTHDATCNFPTFAEMNDCQQRIIVNGLKQRLSDRVAGGESAQSRYETMAGTANSLRANVYSTRGVSNKAAELASELKLAINATVYALVQSGKDPAKALAYASAKPIEWLRGFMVEPAYAAAVAEYRKSLTAGIVIDLSDLEDAPEVGAEFGANGDDA